MVIETVPEQAPGNGNDDGGDMIHSLAHGEAGGHFAGPDNRRATGTMGYEVVDACDGWSVRQRLRMTVTDNEDHEIEMVSDYSTYESKDGLRFSFHMKQMTEGAITSQTDGTARLTRRGGPGEAHYTSPEEGVKKLPAGTLFPMAHTAAVVTAARDGRRFLTAPLFDGTVDQGAQDSSVAILGLAPPGTEQIPGARFAAIDPGADRLLRPQAGGDHARLPGRHALLGKRRRR